MSVSPPARSVWSPTKPSEAGYTSTYSIGRPIHSSTVARYGANETPPWMRAPRFAQHSPRLATDRPAARRARATRSKRIKSHEGIPEMSLRSWPWMRSAAASIRWSQSGIDAISRPGE